MKSIVLLSGGQDSTTVLAMLKKESPSIDVHALFIHYGQRHAIERGASRAIAAHFCTPWTEIDLSVLVPHLHTNALTNHNLKLQHLNNALPTSYVPGRNLIFLSIAAAAAASSGATMVGIGVNAMDWSGYPDCTPEFIKRFNEVLQIGIVPSVRIYAPLLHMKKSEIIECGTQLGVPWDKTWTCYNPKRYTRPCGACPACTIRAEAFRELRQPDPLLLKWERGKSWGGK